MTEWSIVTVIVVLLGLVVTVMTPLLKLNGNITRLNATLETLDRRMNKIEQENRASHTRLWTKNTEQDGRLNEHDQRLLLLERKE